MTTFWLVRHFMGSWRRFFDLTMCLSVLGLAIGVASLVVSMSVVSGYETTLKHTVQNVVGHLLVFKRGSGDPEHVLEELKPEIPGFRAATPFVYVDAIVAHGGQLNGAVIEGADPATVQDVLDLRGRVVEGDDALGTGLEEIPPILVGKGIAEKFKMKRGDVIRVVVPLANDLSGGAFRPKVSKFEIRGILSYGRADFDSRYMVTHIRAAQELAEIGSRVTGFRMRLDRAEESGAVAAHIMDRFHDQYMVRDWVDVNRNLFEAVKLEKVVLFFVLMILVIVACFNVSSTLYMSVVQRYRDISVMKALGASDAFIKRLFTLMGLMVGVVGSVVGLGLGLLVCWWFEWAQAHLGILPKDVYKLDHIHLDMRGWDMGAIVGVTLLICYVATLIPARRGARVVPVEGLRYE